MPCSVSFFDGAPEQVFDVLLSHLPFNRDVARLGASCSAAASALRLHLAALHRDFSLGAEPRHPVAVLPLPPCSIRPPVPLNFTYNAALGLWAGGGGLLTADDGCNATCACCNRNHAHRYFSMDWSSAAAGSTLGTGIAPAAAAAAAAGYQPDPARRPAQLHGGGGPARRRCHDQDRIETDGATHPCKEAAAQAMQTASKEQRSLMESDSDHRSTSRSRPISGGDGCSFSNRGLRKDCNDSAFVVVDGDSGGGSICDDVYGGYGQRDDAVILWCSCPCGVAVPSRQPAYDMKVGGLSPHLCTGVPTGGASAAYIMECGPACACSPACGQVHPRRPRECGWERGLEDTGLKMEAHGGVSRSTSPCPTRLTQGGLVVRVAIRWQEAKGWGVVALEPIPARRFICLYGGEYVTTTEAEGRLKEYDVAGQGHALLVVREILLSGLALRINIDATLLGNVARFFNHSCDGGNMMLMVVRRRGNFVPAVALFASRNITVGEELTFAYGSPSRGNGGFCTRAGHAGDKAGGGGRVNGLRPCHCGTPACLGYMPSDEL